MSEIKAQLFALLHKLFELPANTLTGQEILNDENAQLSWTSIEMIGFIALCDEQFNVIVPSSEVFKAHTVSDLIAIVENKINSPVTA